MFEWANESLPRRDVAVFLVFAGDPAILMLTRTRDVFSTQICSVRVAFLDQVIFGCYKAQR